METIKNILKLQGYKIAFQPETVYVLYMDSKPFSLSPLTWKERRELEKETGKFVWRRNSTTRKAYFTKGRAKCGIANLPACLRDKVKIVEYKPVGEI